MNCVIVDYFLQALHHLLLCSTSLYPNGEHIDSAIQAVGESKSEELIQQLTDYLMGDTDDTPKVQCMRSTIPRGWHLCHDPILSTVIRVR